MFFKATMSRTLDKNKIPAIISDVQREYTVKIDPKYRQPNSLENSQRTYTIADADIPSAPQIEIRFFRLLF